MAENESVPQDLQRLKGSIMLRKAAATRRAGAEARGDKDGGNRASDELIEQELTRQALTRKLQPPSHE